LDSQSFVYSRTVLAGKATTIVNILCGKDDIMQLGMPLCAINRCLGKDNTTGY